MCVGLKVFEFLSPLSFHWNFCSIDRNDVLSDLITAWNPCSLTFWTSLTPASIVLDGKAKNLDKSCKYRFGRGSKKPGQIFQNH